MSLVNAGTRFLLCREQALTRTGRGIVAALAGRAIYARGHASLVGVRVVGTTRAVDLSQGRVRVHAARARLRTDTRVVAVKALRTRFTSRVSFINNFLI